MNPWEVGSQLNGLTSVTSVRCVDWVSSPPPTLRRYHQWPHLTSASMGTVEGRVWLGTVFFGATIPDRPRVLWKWTKRTRWTHRKYKDTHSVITISANPYLTITSGTLQPLLWRRIIPIHEKHRYKPGLGPYHCQDKCPCALISEKRCTSMWLNFGYVTNFGTLLEMKVWKIMIHVQRTIFQVPC